MPVRICSPSIRDASGTSTLTSPTGTRARQASTSRPAGGGAPSVGLHLAVGHDDPAALADAPAAADAVERDAGRDRRVEQRLPGRDDDDAPVRDRR